MTTPRAILTALVACCLLAPAAAGAPAPAEATGDVEQQIVALTQEIAALKRQLWQETGKTDAYSLANGMIAKTEQLDKTDLTGTERKARDVIWATLQNAVKTRNENLEAGQPKQVKDNSQALARDAVVLAADVDQRANLAPLDVWSATQLCPVPVGGTESTLRILLGWRLLPAWGLCLLITLLVVAVVAYDRRVGVRRFLRPIANRLYNTRPVRSAVVTSAVCLLACLTLFSSSCSSRAAADLERDLLTRHVQQLEKERDQTLAELKKQQESAKQMATENEGRVDTHVKNWAEHVAGASPDAQKVRDELGQAEKTGHQIIRGVSTEVATAGSAGTSASGKLSVIQQAADRIDLIRQTIASYSRKVAGTRTGLYAAFFLGNGLLALVWYRRRSAAERKNYVTCPQCLAMDKLKPTKQATPDARNPEGEVVECEECKYQMRPLYRKIPRVCFPTVGYGRSGKTLWMTMFHQEVRFGQASTAKVHLERASSLGQTDKVFDELLKEVLEHHAPSPTSADPHNIPQPLLFHFVDGATILPHGGLLNIFDFAGSSMYKDFEGSKLQQRALGMDGFLYFLDPTGLSSREEQNEVLRHFREQLRIAQRVAVGDPVKLPVAICITKLDLLPENETGTGTFHRFVDSLLEIGGDDKAPTLAVIRRRHDLFRPYRAAIFPGWEIEEQFSNLFAGRFMFFPMTSVGFTELGEEDLKKRNYRPYGIIEPILWLLHMNGFETLA